MSWQPIKALAAVNVTTGFSNMELGGYMDFQNACAQATGQTMDDFPNWFRMDDRVNQIGTGTVAYGCWWNGEMIATFPSLALKNDLASPYCLKSIAAQPLDIYSDPDPTATRLGTVAPGETVQPSSTPALLRDVNGETWIAIATPVEGWVRHGMGGEPGNFECCE